ncbi:hypothetical protein M427DRAFT_63588 [Gonapodya prolifera JEL478]|uniref:Uncharacterized protein n=1 Tax=Gonapodya prolifera (strain JEL478) TaxID=1344416 RepID=A0A138ZYV9_GONPJ|nr:hypothetical protein M427DRAFT_63588 [Gonapodya prolifera JEL478]|eukprot:KXS09694.1 hypothetical protein M427DRAFT_63588 [Gonapodya prolifera JEL478]
MRNNPWDITDSTAHIVSGRWDCDRIKMSSKSFHTVRSQSPASPSLKIRKPQSRTFQPSERHHPWTVRRRIAGS